MTIEAMKQALAALEDAQRHHYALKHKETDELITALRSAIEQAQEPVAWMNPSWIDPDTRGWASDSFESIEIEGWVPLYTEPRHWKDLTDEEIKAPIQRAMQHFGFNPTQYSLGGMATIGFLILVREIEAKLKAKNNG